IDVGDAAAGPDASSDAARTATQSCPAPPRSRRSGRRGLPLPRGSRQPHRLLGRAQVRAPGSDGELLSDLRFEARAEYEYFHNQMWGGGPQDTDGYYLGRLIPAVGLTLQPHVRLFAAFQYEKESGNPAGPRPGIDEDEGDFDEAFVDLSTGLDQPRSVTARLGQQELVYGTGRLVDNNEGVNVKSSFYGGRIILRRDDLR